MCLKVAGIKTDDDYDDYDDDDDDGDDEYSVARMIIDAKTSWRQDVGQVVFIYDVIRGQFNCHVITIIKLSTNGKE